MVARAVWGGGAMVRFLLTRPQLTFHGDNHMGPGKCPDCGTQMNCLIGTLFVCPKNCDQKEMVTESKHTIVNAAVVMDSQYFKSRTCNRFGGGFIHYEYEPDYVPSKDKDGNFVPQFARFDGVLYRSAGNETDPRDREEYHRYAVMSMDQSPLQHAFWTEHRRQSIKIRGILTKAKPTDYYSSEELTKQGSAGLWFPCDEQGEWIQAPREIAERINRAARDYSGWN